MNAEIDTGKKVDPQNPVNSAIDWPTLPILFDSLLASRFTQVYRELKSFWGNEALQRVKQGFNPLGFEQLLTISSLQAFKPSSHLAMVRHLESTARPAIVIAGNGKCKSGRIVNYLKAMLHGPRRDVLSIGYQAQGTPGRAMQMYGERGGYVDLDKERYKIGAKVHTIGGYSAHAGQKGFDNFVTRMREWPSEVRNVHGELGAKKQFSDLLRACY